MSLCDCSQYRNSPRFGSTLGPSTGGVPVTPALPSAAPPSRPPPHLSLFLSLSHTYTHTHPHTRSLCSPQLDLSDTTKWKALTFRQEISKPGLYSFIYARCGPDGGFTSFSLRAELYNPGPNYLSIGDANLPTLFMVFFVLFFAALVTWIVVCRRSKTNVHYIHYMMTMLCFFKMCTLLFESIKFHYMKTRGQPVGWHVMYYIFDFAKVRIGGPGVARRSTAGGWFTGGLRVGGCIERVGEIASLLNCVRVCAGRALRVLEKKDDL